MYSRPIIDNHKREFVVLFACAALLAGVFSYSAGREPVASAETRFVETSESGLQIVPASCPSGPHYTGECSGDPGHPVGWCTIYASDYSIEAGESTTLAWHTSDGFGSDMGGWTVNYSYSSGSITDIGGVPRSGSAPVSPSQTRQYVFTANYESDWLSILAPPVTVTCDATVTVGAQSCPPGYILQGSQCVSTPTPTPTPTPGQCSAQYFCSGDDQYYRNAQCQESFVEACAWGCSGGGCLPPPPPQGNITANPTVVRSGNTSVISWTTQYTESCTVTEDNEEINNSWSGPSGTQTSGALTQQTVYTLRCIGLDGSELLDSAKVNIIPVWEEQ